MTEGKVFVVQMNCSKIISYLLERLERLYSWKVNIFWSINDVCVCLCVCESVYNHRISIGYQKRSSSAACLSRYIKQHSNAAQLDLIALGCGPMFACCNNYIIVEGLQVANTPLSFSLCWYELSFFRNVYCRINIQITAMMCILLVCLVINLFVKK